MVPRRVSPHPQTLRAPRSRGDGPRRRPGWTADEACSPLARGWSHQPALHRRAPRVLPARAGMVLTPRGSTRRAPRAPRSRGDGPRPRSTPPCARSVLPARAGMVPTPVEDHSTMLRAPRSRGDGPRAVKATALALLCSPLARGWSEAEVDAAMCEVVLPARAGMVPLPTALADSETGAPRSRGDGPVVASWPSAISRCSPLARGWSLGLADRLGVVIVLPARAGMVRGSRRYCRTWSRAPRSRGDGPMVLRWVGVDWTCSPLARGWSAWPRSSRTG